MAEQNNVGLALFGGAVVLGGLVLLTRKSGPGPGPGAFRLTISAGPNGTTDPEPGVYSYAANEQVIVYAQPATGYKFDRWTGGDLQSGMETVNPATVTVTKDLTLTANFVANPTPTQYLVTFVATAGGTVSPSGPHSYQANSYVTVVATPSTGYKFAGWSTDWTGIQNPTQVYVWKDNMQVVANFTPIQQTGVQLQAGWNRGITYNGNQGVCSNVFASVLPYLLDVTKPIWIYRNGVWYYWFPNAVYPAIYPPPNDLVLPGDICSIYVTQACFWTWS